MKKILITLFCLPIIGFSQTTWTACDSSFLININSQNSIEVIYSVSGPNLNINSTFSWVYFNMLGSCIGGGAFNSPTDTVNIINNLPDSTAIMCMISDSLNLASCIVSDTLVYDSISGWHLSSNNIASTFTYVPDDNFEAYLEANGMGNGIANDDYVTTANIDSVTMLGLNGINSVSISNISDLTGIEAFTALEDFSIIVTQITSLDLSANTALTYINCTGNQLISLDVTGCVALTSLSCDQNYLTSLNVSQNTALVVLACYYNEITTLDLSQNPVLINLACSNNNLSNLDARNGINFTYAFNASNNPNLTCISVDDTAYATANYFVDPQSSFSLNCIVPGCTDSLACNYDSLAIINDSSCIYLNTSVSISNVSCYGNADGNVIATANGGATPNYQYSLGGGLSQTSGTFSNLTAGTYFIDVTDINGCSSNQIFTITEPNPIGWQWGTVICYGDSVVVGASIYDTTGNYIDTLTTVNGCDSIVYTNVSLDYYTSSYDTLSVGASILWNEISLNVSGDYSVILINSVGCDSIVNLNLTVTTTGVSEITNKSNLIKITDMFGQETPYIRNTPLFYIYDDGTIEKRITVE